MEEKRGERIREKEKEGEREREEKTRAIGRNGTTGLARASCV